MKTLLAAIFSSLFFPYLAVAAGIQVSPPELNISGPAGKVLHRDIVVANPTPDVQLFEVSADDFEKNIQPRPASFTLEAGSRKIVTLDITPADNQLISTSLSIVGHPLVGALLQTNAAVKIPIKITTGSGRTLPWWAWVIGGFVVIMIALAVYLMWKKKRVSPTII